jgi:alkylation response protein AidB-like acyl-CoA dehydrogenase
VNAGSGAAEEALRAEVRAALAEAPVARALAAVMESDDREPDVRPLYRELGRRGLLAVSWPREYGGRGAAHREAAAVVEELVLAGVPDMPHVLSIQIVGLFLLQAGSADQKERYLPALAAGERFATVLYTEPEVGSDLAALRARAVREEDGYRLSGTKVYGLKSAFSDFALCAMRTGDGPTKYDGISLFLLDLCAPGVTRSTIGSVADDRFDRVDLRDVPVGAENLLGTEGDGWGLLTRCLAIERTGLDYSLKARRWFDATVSGLAATGVDDALLAEIGRYGAAVETGRLLAWDVLGGLDRGEADSTAAAMAKYHTSVTAQRIAEWGALVHGSDYRARDLAPAGARVLESGFREAPGLTLSAGTSEMMLELVASSLAGGSREEDGGRRGSDD